MIQKVTSLSETQELVLGDFVNSNNYLNNNNNNNNSQYNNPNFMTSCPNSTSTELTTDNSNHQHLGILETTSSTRTRWESEEPSSSSSSSSFRNNFASSSSSMVSCYNPVAMFGRSGSGHHHHHHHTSPSTNHYFAPAYSGYHPHHNHHTVPPTSTVGVGVGVGVSSTQFSPNMAPDFNCNHQYNHHFGNMTPDSASAIAAAAATSWHQPAVYSAYHRNIVSGYEVPEWPHGHHNGHHSTSFYPHQQPSPPSSTPSPNPSHNSSSNTNNNTNNNSVACSGGAPNNHNNNNNNSNNGNHSPTSNVYNNNNLSFKTEFGPCSGGNPQENASQEMQTQGPVVSSAGPSTGTPHSPDSGMAISDGVSSSGSPATTGIGGQQHCHSLGGHLNSSSVNPQLHNSNSLIGSQQQQQNLNPNSLHAQRPAQARSPYEWMKKPSYSISSNSNGKTRTKDKYRVVYSDTQRLELEKEFHYNRYITIRRKAELASILGLSERQVKIWFQNRRAKERKVVRKRDEMMTREKLANNLHMVQLQNNVANGMPHVTGPMCNQGNGNAIPMM